MKVHVLAPAYPLRGGISQYVTLLVETLRRDHGHDARILAFRRQYPALLFPGKTQRDPSRRPLQTLCEPIFDPYSPTSWIRTAHHVRRETPDLLILKWWIPLFGLSFWATCSLVRRLCPTKVVYILDNVVPHERRPLDERLTRLALDAGHYFVAQSETVRDEFLERMPEHRNQLRTVPHPIYDVFADGLAPSQEDARKRLSIREPHVVLFFGYVRPYKGLRYLLEAMPKLCESADVRLLVVGEFYEGKAAYLAQIARLGMEGRVTVHDAYVPNEDVATYFRAADVVALPYISASQSGIVQIAYGFDLPVITTDVGGLPEVVRDGETGLLVPPQDADALACALIRFFREGMRGPLSDNVTRAKGQYGWEALVRTLEDFAACPN